MKTRKATITPKYTESQIRLVKTNCRKSNKFETQIILDHKTHCPFKSESIHGLNYYSCVNKHDVPVQYKYMKKKITKK